MDDEIYIGVRLWFAKTSFRLARWVVVPCFMATTGSTWRQLPPVFGPAWPTVYRRFARWSRERVRARLHRVVLDELGARGELDRSRRAIDSVSVRAVKGGH